MNTYETLKQTIMDNEIELRNDAELVVDLLADDFMVYLGYDRKKEKGIRKINSTAYKVELDGKEKFVILFQKYGGNLDESNAKACYDLGYEFVIVTDSDRLNIWAKGYGLILGNNEVYFLRDKISRYNIDLQQLKDEAIAASSVSEDKAKEMVLRNLDSLCKTLIQIECLNDNEKNRTVICNVMSNAMSGNEHKLTEQSREELEGTTEINSDREKDYRRQITELANKNGTLEEELLRVKDELKTLQESQVSEKEAKRNIAKTLIEAVEDDGESDDRLYVAAINSKLFQNKDLAKFIGNCINELYNIVKYKLMAVLYNGDFFKFKNPATKEDFVISNKSYEIDFRGETEQSLIGKLQMLFEKFPEDNIAFEYKLIGRESDLSELEDEFIETESDESDSELLEEETEDLFEEEDEEYSDEEKLDDAEEHIDEAEEKLEIAEDMLEIAEEDLFDSGDNDILTSDSGIEEYIVEDAEQDGTEENTSKLVGIDILSLSNIAWNSEVVIDSISYVGGNNRIFKVETPEDIAKTVTKVIDTLILLSNNKEETASKLKSMNLKETSVFIGDYDSKCKDTARITFTNFGIMELDNFSKGVPIIQSIYNEISQGLKVTIYLRVKTESRDYDEFIVEEESLDLSENINIANNLSENNKAGCIILGDIIDKTVMTKSSLVAQAKIISQCLALKTHYYTLDISTQEKKIIALKTMMEQESDWDIELVGNVLNESYKVISTNESEVSSENYSLNYKDKTLYISAMLDWQWIYAFIKIHTVVSKNKQIAIKCVLNKDALDAYKNQFKSIEPALELSVNTIVNYLYHTIK